MSSRDMKMSLGSPPLGRTLSRNSKFTNTYMGTKIQSITGNPAAFDRVDPFTAEKSLVQALEKTVQRREFLENQKTTIMSMRADSPKATAANYHTSGSLDGSTTTPLTPISRAKAAKSKTASTASVEWRGYAQSKRKEQARAKKLARQNQKAGKQSSISQVLSEVRALENTVQVKEFKPTPADFSAVAMTRVTTPNGGSQRVARLKDNRRKRHEETMWGYYDFRLSTDKRLQGKVEGLGLDLKERFTKSEKDMRTLLMSLSDDVIVNWTEKDIDQSLAGVEREFEDRMRSIDVLGEDLANVEVERANVLKDKLKQVVSDLTDIAHALPAEIQRSLNEKANEINVHVLRNHGSYNELLARLRISDIKKLELYRKQWTVLKHRWRKVRHKRALVEFQKTLTSDAWLKPVRRRKLLNELMEGQQSFVRKCTEKIQKLLAMKPPALTEHHVELIARQIINIHMDSDQEMDSCLQAIKSLEEEMHRNAFVLMEKLKANLLYIDAYKENVIDREILHGCMPLEERRHASVLQMVAQVDAALGFEEAKFIGQMENICNFFKRAALCWETYVKDTRDLNGDWDEKLAYRADTYADQLEHLEDDLDNTLYKLRREPNEQRLEERLNAVVKLVGAGGQIEQVHREYNRDSVKMAQEHPIAYQQCIAEHLSTMAYLWGLRSRTKDQEYKRRQEEEDAKRVEEEGKSAELEERAMASRLGKKGRKLRGGDDAADASGSGGSTEKDHDEDPRTHRVVKRETARARKKRLKMEQEAREEAERLEAERRKNDPLCDPRDRIIIDDKDLNDKLFYIIFDEQTFTTSILDGTALQTEGEREEAEMEKRRKEAAEKQAEEEAELLRVRLEEEEKKKSRRRGGARMAAGIKKRDKRKQDEEDAKNTEEEEKKKAEEEKEKSSSEDEKKNRIQLFLDNIPCDTDGLPVYTSIRFEFALVEDAIPNLRTDYLQLMNEWAEDEGEKVAHYCQQRQVVLAKALDYELRQLRPRLARLETDVYDTRIIELHANVSRYQRHSKRMKQILQTSQTSYSQQLEVAHREMLFFTQWKDTLSNDINKCQSLAALNDINKRVKARVVELHEGLEQQRENFINLSVELKTQSTTLDNIFIESCILIPDDLEIEVEGGTNSKKSKKSKKNKSKSRSGKNGDHSDDRDANAVSNGVEGSYHPEEVNHYKELLQLQAEDRKNVLAIYDEHRKNYDTRVEEVCDLSAFDDRYHCAHQELAVQQGLGHKYGAPKRKLTTRIREEFGISERQSNHINTLLGELRALLSPEQLAFLRDRKQIVEKSDRFSSALIDKEAAALEAEQEEDTEKGPSSATVSNTTNNSNQSDTNSTSTSHSNSNSNSKIKHIDGLPSNANTEGAEQAGPVSRTDNIDFEQLQMHLQDGPKEWLSVHLMNKVDDIRVALSARAKYLECLKPERPEIELTAVTAVPQLGPEFSLSGESLKTADSAESGADDNKSASSSSSSSSSSSAATAAAASLASPKAHNRRAMRKRETEATKDSKRRDKESKKKAEREAKAAAAEEAENKAPDFMSIVRTSAGGCRKEMNVLYTQYDEANPDRERIFDPSHHIAKAKKVETKVEEAVPEKKEKKRGKKSKKDKGQSKRDKKNKKDKESASSSSTSSKDKEETSDALYIPPAIELHCQHEISRAAAKLEEYIKEFRAQTDLASSLLTQVPKMVFEDVCARSKLNVELLTGLFQKSFENEMRQFNERKEGYSAMLKPSIGSRSESALNELNATEAKRLQDTLKAISDHRFSLWKLEASNTRLFLQRVLHVSGTLVALNDSFLMPPDLPLPPDDQAQFKRKSLKQLVKESNRGLIGAAAVEESKQEKREGEKSSRKKGKRGHSSLSSSSSAGSASDDLADAESDDSGKRFATHSWQGIPLNEFKLPDDIVEIMKATSPELMMMMEQVKTAEEEAAELERKQKELKRPSNSRRGKRSNANSARDTARSDRSVHYKDSHRGRTNLEGDGEAKKKQMVYSAALKGFQIAANRMVISHRLKCYRAYLEDYNFRTGLIDAAAEYAANEQLRHQQQWNTTVQQLMKIRVKGGGLLSHHMDSARSGLKSTRSNASAMNAMREQFGNMKTVDTKKKGRMSTRR